MQPSDLVVLFDAEGIESVTGWIEGLVRRTGDGDEERRGGAGGDRGVAQVPRLLRHPRQLLGPLPRRRAAPGIRADRGAGQVAGPGRREPGRRPGPRPVPVHRGDGGRGEPRTRDQRRPGRRRRGGVAGRRLARLARSDGGPGPRVQPQGGRQAARSLAQGGRRLAGRAGREAAQGQGGGRQGQGQGSGTVGRQLVPTTAGAEARGRRSGVPSRAAGASAPRHRAGPGGARPAGVEGQQRHRRVRADRRRPGAAGGLDRRRAAGGSDRARPRPRCAGSPSSPPPRSGTSSSPARTRNWPTCGPSRTGWRPPPGRWAGRTSRTSSPTPGWAPSRSGSATSSRARSSGWRCGCTRHWPGRLTQAEAALVATRR